MGRVPRFFVVNLLRKHSGHNGRIGQFAKFVKFDTNYTVRGKGLAGAAEVNGAHGPLSKSRNGRGNPSINTQSNERRKLVLLMAALVRRLLGHIADEM
jgi:hypothetical protein